MALVRKAAEPALTAAEAAQAKALENELFGGADALLQRVAGNATDKATDGAATGDLLPQEETEHDESTVPAALTKRTKPQKRTRVPVWSDPDTQGIEVDIRAAPRLRKLRKDESDSTLKGLHASSVPVHARHRQRLFALSWCRFHAQLPCCRPRVRGAPPLVPWQAPPTDILGAAPQQHFEDGRRETGDGCLHHAGHTNPDPQVRPRRHLSFPKPDHSTGAA